MIECCSPQDYCLLLAYRCIALCLVFRRSCRTKFRKLRIFHDHSSFTAILGCQEKFIQQHEVTKCYLFISIPAPCLFISICPVIRLLTCCSVSLFDHCMCNNYSFKIFNKSNCVGCRAYESSHNRSLTSIPLFRTF